MIFAALLIAASLCALALTPLVRRVGIAAGLVDLPGTRTVHVTAIPRVGGIAVVVSAAAAVALVSLVEQLAGRVPSFHLAPLMPILAGAAIVFAIGLWDDVRNAGPATKLGWEIVAAAVPIAAGVVIERVTLFGTSYPLGVFAAPATAVWILTVTNAFNLIDGLDGLAAGLAVIAAATCGTILALRGHQPEALLLVALAGAAVGFLRYNFHPATIFLGDAGSLLVGYVLAVTAITGWQKGATVLAVGVPVLMFAIPLADAATTIGRRLARRPLTAGFRGSVTRLARVFQPDRRHLHHLLLDHGVSHTRTVLLLYAVSLSLSVLALWTMAAK